MLEAVGNEACAKTLGVAHPVKDIDACEKLKLSSLEAVAKDMRPEGLIWH